MTRNERIEHVEQKLRKQQVWTSEQLERLADYLLQDSLSSQTPNKSQVEEYPILSSRQLERRYMRECVTLSALSEEKIHELLERQRDAQSYYD